MTEVLLSRYKLNGNHGINGVTTTSSATSTKPVLLPAGRRPSSHWYFDELFVFKTITLCSRDGIGSFDFIQLTRGKK